jgi:rSAM/selenodomain-associated transferase 1
METARGDAPMTDALYIAAKAPRVGLAKTRLGRSIGHEPAIALYKAFLRDLAARFADAPFECGWYLTPPDAWDDVSPLVGWGEQDVRVLFQKEGDWTERQRAFFREAAARNEERVVLIGSDSPHLTVEVIARAFRELDRHDLVFGPTYDGGYYLVGMRGFNDVFHGVSMSTGTELEGIIARAGSAGLSVGWVEATFDIDEVEDLEHLQQLVERRTDLAATRAALETLGLYRHRRSTMMEPAGTRPIAAEDSR